MRQWWLVGDDAIALLRQEEFAHTKIISSIIGAHPLVSVGWRPAEVQGACYIERNPQTGGMLPSAPIHPLAGPARLRPSRCCTKQPKDHTTFFFLLSFHLNVSSPFWPLCFCFSLIFICFSRVFSFFLAFLLSLFFTLPRIPRKSFKSVGHNLNNSPNLCLTMSDDASRNKRSGE